MQLLEVPSGDAGLIGRHDRVDFQEKCAKFGMWLGWAGMRRPA